MKVLCIPDFFIGSKEISEYVETRGVFLKRDVAEGNFAYRQIIPYIIVVNGEKKILTYQRRNDSGDKRLRGQYTIGVGGHVDETDGGASWKAVLRARNREIREELSVEPVSFYRKKEVIRLDETEIDRVHIGVAMIMTKWEGNMEPTDEVISFEWKTREELLRMKLESWSNYILDFVSKSIEDMV